jgi:beta-lactamase class A
MMLQRNRIIKTRDKQTRQQLTILVLGFACVSAPISASPAPSAQADVSTVQAEINRITAPVGGEIGLAAWRLDGRGPRVLVNADKSFPMASTFKIAVAGALFAKVDRGELALDQMLAVPPAAYVESEIIADALPHPGVSLSLHNLIDLMLTRSDNTATDVLTATAGGPETVTAWVRKQGVTGLRVDRDTAGIVRDFFGLPKGTFSEALAKARQADPKLDSRGEHPNPAFDDDPRDSSTPTAMGELLTRIFNGQALSPQSTAALTAIMEHCHTSDKRLRAWLPEKTTVADKTGTLGGSVNDVGVITLPDNRGQFVIAVFIKKSDQPFEARESVIASVGRAVYDFFLFAGAAKTE